MAEDKPVKIKLSRDELNTIKYALFWRAANLICDSVDAGRNPHKAESDAIVKELLRLHRKIKDVLNKAKEKEPEEDEQ